MLSIGVLGIGNAGNQVATLALSHGIPCVAINTSENDLAMVPDGVKKFLIGDSRGAGKDRSEAKGFLKGDIMKILKNDELKSFILDQDFVFIVSSTGGGTGSGTAPILYETLNQMFTDTNFILVGILPTLNEALSAQTNTIEYLKELYDSITNCTYMIYDNEKFEKMPSYRMMEVVNKAIVDDMMVMRGDYNYPTKYDSIDQNDMTRLLTTPGRIAIASIYGCKEKDFDDTTMEEAVVEDFKHNAHAELQRDKRRPNMGLITNLNERLNENFDTHIPTVRAFLGEPIHDFRHIVVNSDRSLDNNIFVIATGLSKIEDRVVKTSERIEEIVEAQRAAESARSDDTLEGLDIDNLIPGKKRRNTESSIDVASIFDKFQ
nr:MAG TPA: hypothetical protein [Caudoviricetes sp.]